MHDHQKPQDGDPSLWRPSRSLGFDGSYAERRRLTVIALAAVAGLIALVQALALLLG